MEYFHQFYELRGEWEDIPQGISVSNAPLRVHIYIRDGDQIAAIRLPKTGWTDTHGDRGRGTGGMYYEILS